MRTAATNTMRKSHASPQIVGSPLRINGRWRAVKAVLQEEFVGLAAVDLFYRIGEEERLIGTLQAALGFRRQEAIDTINKAADDARRADEKAQEADDQADAGTTMDEELDFEPWNSADEFSEPRKRPMPFDD